MNAKRCNNTQKSNIKNRANLVIIWTVITVDNVSNSLNTLNDGGNIESLSIADGNAYITYKVGADSVTKKLGNSVSEITIKVTDYLFAGSGAGHSYAVAEVYADGVKILTISTKQQDSDNTGGRWQPASKTGSYTFN